MATKWLRYCRLVIGTDETNQQAYDLSDFRIHFIVRQAPAGKPTECQITVYNVNRDLAGKIQAPRIYDPAAELRPVVILEAGYVDNHAIIFRGDLCYKSLGRESETDTVLRLLAATSDRAHLYSFVGMSLPAGWTQRKMMHEVFSSMATNGLTGYDTPKLSERKHARGRVICGRAADIVGNVADGEHWSWGYSNGKMLAFSDGDNGCEGEAAIELTSLTGMLGRPSITVDGLHVKCLLDPRIYMGTAIHVNNASIQRGYGSADPDKFEENQGVTDQVIDADGFYRVFSVEHEGATRGVVWETRMICTGANAEIKAGYRTIGTFSPESGSGL